MENKIGTFAQEKNVVMNGWAPYYDMFMKVFTLGREKTLRNVELDITSIKDGHNVLEIGCGTGTLTLLAKDRVGNSGKVFGIDAASKMIKVAQKKTKRRRKDIEFRVGDISNLPYDNNTFDIVLCSFMIFHITSEKREKGLTDIFRVLKNNGALVIVDTINEEGVNILVNSMKPTFSNIEYGYKKSGFLLPKLAYIKGITRK